MSEATDIWSAEKIILFKAEFIQFLNHCFINSKETGGNTILGEHIFGSQTRVLDEIFAGLAEGKHDFKVLKSRQLGISTFARAFSLFWLGVHDGLQGAMIFDTDANKENARRELEAMIDSLPAFIKFPRIKVRNRYGIILENGSKLQFLSAGTRKGRSGGGLGRSSGLNFIHASEMCQWENEEGVEALKPSLSKRFPNRLYIWESPLALDTPLLTPHGWTTIGAVRAGDFVFDENGQTTEVVGFSPVFEGRRCFEITFDTGEKIISDAAHKWQVERRKPKSAYKPWSTKVVTTEQLDPDLDRIWLGEPVEGIEHNLPIHPYLIGAWLGDGHNEAIRITCGEQDMQEMRANLKSRGIEIGSITKFIGRSGGVFGIRGLMPTFRELNLIGNKHIPDIYLRSSVTDRLELMRGLMDTDGSITVQGHCLFTNSCVALINNFCELLSSLGIKYHVNWVYPGAKKFPNGKTYDCKPYAMIGFMAPSGMDIFSLKRKLDRQNTGAPRRPRRNRVARILSIVECPSVPVKCLSVDTPTHLFKVGRTMIPTHNTARGPNLWQTMWEEAVSDDITQKPIFIGWWSRDDQRLEKGSALYRKYAKHGPTDKELERIAKVKELYGVDIDMEQLAWFRSVVDPDQSLEEDESEDPLKTQEQPWCVAANTRVGTDKGILKITDVIAGMSTALGRVEASFPTGTAQVWRATTYLGYSVEGTGNHPLINIHGKEVELQSSINTAVKLQPPRLAGEIYTHRWASGIIEHSVKITPEVAKFVGIFMGDGTISGVGGRVGYQFSIACDAKDKDFIELVHGLVRGLFGVDTQERTIGGCTDVRCSSKLVYETLVGLGLTRTDSGRTMRKVHVPEFIWRSPKEVVAEFLSGLFETDGFVDKEASRVSLFSKYEDFIPDIQRLLLSFGITCRITDVEKTNGEGRKYRGRQLELRAAEAEKFIADIGFLSDRKKLRSSGYLKKKKTGPRKPISMADIVVRVQPCLGRIELVYNLTTDGNHWYDANGIVTHNTADEAFQITGSTFFSPTKLTQCMSETASPDFQSYKFFHGTDFFHTRVEKARSLRETQLKIWEEPVSDATYVIAADPAYGHRPENNHSAIQVLRCYADRIEQVAEFADSETPTSQFAWVIAALCGWYGVDPNGTYKNHIEVIIEINGPGEAVLNSFKDLKNVVNSPSMRREATERGLKNIFQNVKNYMYSRSDSYAAGNSLHWKTTGQLKEAIFERLRDWLYSETLIIRSMAVLQEMQKIVRDGETIGAPGMQRDDRTFSLAMGIRSWEDRLRRPMLAAGQTKQKDSEKRKVTPQDKFAIFNRHQIESMFKRSQMNRIAALRNSRYKSWHR